LNVLGHGLACARRAQITESGARSPVVGLRQSEASGAVLAGVAGRSGSSFGASLGITDFLKLARGQNAVTLLDTGGQAGLSGEASLTGGARRPPWAQ
jgi:hypothetical protein